MLMEFHFKFKHSSLPLKSYHPQTVSLLLDFFAGRLRGGDVNLVSTLPPPPPPLSFFFIFSPSSFSSCPSPFFSSSSATGNALLDDGAFGAKN